MLVYPLKIFLQVQKQNSRTIQTIVKDNLYYNKISYFYIVEMCNFYFILYSRNLKARVDIYIHTYMTVRLPRRI